MAKKEKKSGLGKGINSLFPKIEEKEVEEGLSLEDILKAKEDDTDFKEEEPADEDKEIIFDDEEEEEEEEIIIEEEPEEEEELISEEEPVDADKELTFSEEDFKDDEGILVEESDVEKYEEEIVEEEVDGETATKESSQYTNVFNNDDIRLAEDEEENSFEEAMKNIKSLTNLNEKTEESTQIMEAFDDINEGNSFLNEKEEKLICEVIETVEKNPRITLWSARSAAVLRYLRKTEPEFSISNEASNLIDEAIAEKYPEIWTLFNHL